LLIASAGLSRAAEPMATIRVQQDKSCGLAIVAIDNHAFKSPQQRVSVSPGHHVLLLRISPAFYPNFSDNVPCEDTFAPNGRYTVTGLFDPASGRLKVRLYHPK